MISYLDKFSLKGKTAFVCGGCGLIGKEVVKAFAEAHAKTIILDIDEKKGQSIAKELNKQGNVFFQKFDASDLINIENKIEILEKKFEKIDVWVNASYPRTLDWGNKVEKLKLKSWQKNIDMHLNSYAWISRKVCLLMKKNHCGSIINFGSIYGVLGSDFNLYQGTDLTSPMAYSAIKGGIVNLTRYLASYFGKFNIRVNNICPGGVYNHQNKKFVQNYIRKTPLKRMAHSDEIASAVLFLASDAASYLTGSTMMVDGGWSAI